jgi:hypothetical protein
MKPVESYEEDTIYWFFHCTKSSCNLETNGFKSVESNDFDADWGELDFMWLICLQELEIFIFNVQALPITGVVVVSTPQRCFS